MEVGDRLNPQRSYRKGFALKGLRQHIIKTNNPSTIGPGELLTVRFPNLKENQVIIPSTTKLTFNISLAGTDVNRTLVENLGRNIIRKLVLKLEVMRSLALMTTMSPIHIMTAGKLQLKDVMLSFKVLLKLTVKRKMLLNTG